MRLPSLISRFERNTKSGDPFGVAKMTEISESEYRHEDAFPIATSIAIVGRVKRLLEIADQMQHEVSRPYRPNASALTAARWQFCSRSMSPRRSAEVRFLQRSGAELRSTSAAAPPRR